MKRKMTKAQKAWCANYQKETGFEPLMDDYISGEDSFVDAAKFSVQWFEDWTVEALHAVDTIPGDMPLAAQRKGKK